jgi:hypothetical protein
MRKDLEGSGRGFIEVSSRRLSGWTDKNHENLVPWPIVEPSTSQYSARISHLNRIAGFLLLFTYFFVTWLAAKWRQCENLAWEQ